MPADSAESAPRLMPKSLGGQTMGIEIQLRTERGDIVAAVSDPEMVLSRAAREKFSGTRLLRYLAPWGDTIFNQAQAADLANDIRMMKNAYPGTSLHELLTKIELLVGQLSRETHLYLWFVGD